MPAMKAIIDCKKILIDPGSKYAWAGNENVNKIQL